ncbi:MAG TPA: ABC transporter substrate-binding protein [Acidimicrobiia bacterium]|nr:ABC transporter substrate-binding protein [Acidimicrobiia bacterium]
MKTMSNRPRWLLLLFVFALVVAACAEDTATSTTGAAETTTTAGGPTTSTEPAVTSAMTITYDINPDAVWSDGTPVTAADFICTYNAALNTPGSISTAGWDQIISVAAGASDKQVVAEFATVYAPYKGLFYWIIPAHGVTDPSCMDVSQDFLDALPLSARPWQLTSWSLDQAILEPNPTYWGDDKPIAARIVQVPRAEDGGIASLGAGEVDFIFPQAFAGISDALAGDNIKFVAGYGTNYEGLYFQQGEERNGPFADDTFRAAFSKSVDRELILANIYDPIFPGAPLLQCGLWVPTVGPWCQNDQFTNSYDPEGAVALLEGDGWTLNGDGFWEKDGAVPEIKWMINTPNPRRESTQALMIPEFAAAGFNVVADNGDADQVFQQRLPAGDYDLAMYINTASPDPTVTSIMSCSQVPGPENNNQGQNSVFWCNEDASALMQESDVTADEAARADLIHQIGQTLVDDSVMLPLFQFPNVAAWRTDRIEGDAPGADASNYRAFNNSSQLWQPLTDNNEIIIGAEQWPECVNPVTECANSSWMVWTTAFPVLPGVWDTTADGGTVLTNLMAGEPVVTVNE